MTETLTEDSLRAVLDAFYAKVRRDPDLGPVFARAIPDEKWPRHMEIIQDFWSSVMLRTGRYKRNPFAVHLGVEGIRPELFTRWLALFGETCHELLSAPLAEALHERATRIGDSLKAGLFFRPDLRTQQSPSP